MEISNLKLNGVVKNNSTKPKTKVNGFNYLDVNYKPISSENIKANFTTLTFKGNIPQIKNAYIITSQTEDIPLLITKKNDSYVVDFDSQTEIIYGLDAVKYLNSKDEFQYDTQIILPKKATGILHLKNKDIKLNENSAVLLNAGTKANLEIQKGYPMIVVTKKDYDWYEHYEKKCT